MSRRSKAARPGGWRRVKSLGRKLAVLAILAAAGYAGLAWFFLKSALN